MTRSRILISGGLSVGGTQTHITLLCQVLRDADAEVTIAAASHNWPAREIDQLRALGVHVVTSPFGFGPFRFLGKLAAALTWPFRLRRDYDVLYCIGEGKMHLWAGRFVRPRAWKIYHEIVECPARDSVAAEVAAKMDAVIANSRSVGEKITRLLDGMPVRAIPFLTSSEPLDPPAPRAASSTLRIAFLGRLVPHKRPAELIEAWPEWIARAPIGPARLDFHGGDYDNEGHRLQKRIIDLGIENSVRIHGAYTTSALPTILANTDLIVLPSIYEGLPLVLVEAMQRGIPVVATSAGGTAELGEDNPDVLITRGTGWENFAAGLEQMAARIRAGDTDSARLHEWTESRYGFEPVAQAWREALLAPREFFAKPTPAYATP